MAHASRVTLSSDQRGGSFAEYLILAALIAVACVSAWRNFGTSVDDRMDQYAGCIESMAGCAPTGNGPGYPGSGTNPGTGTTTAALTTDPGGGSSPGGSTTDQGGTSSGGDSSSSSSGGGGTPPPPPKQDDKAWYEYPWEGVKGLAVDGLWGDVTGVWDMVTSPVETAKGLGRLAWITSPVGQLVDPSAREDLGAMGTAIWNNSKEYVTEHPDRAVGRAVYEIGTFFIAPAKLLKVGQVTKATKAAKALDALDSLNDVRKIIDNADEVAKARKWADEVLAANKKAPDPRFAARKGDIKSAWEAVKSGQQKLPDSFLPGLTDQQKIDRLKLAIEGDPARGGQRLPLTFKDWKQYDRFKAELDAVLKKNGIDDATVQQIGSGTQGWKGNPDKPSIFGPDGKLNPDAMWRAESDTDFAVFSDKAVTQGKAVNSQIKEKYGTFKNGADEFGPGFEQTPLGKDLKDLSTKWNKEIYGRENVDGFDFKINLGNQPFKSSPTITNPPGTPPNARTLGAPSKADEAEDILHGDDDG